MHRDFLWALEITGTSPPSSHMYFMIFNKFIILLKKKVLITFENTFLNKTNKK